MHSEGDANRSGYINLPNIFPASFGETQFQILCVLAPIVLVITVIITCVVIKEVDPALLFTFPGEAEKDKGGIQAAIGVLSLPIFPNDRC